jgi:hypothetical protein
MTIKIYQAKQRIAIKSVAKFTRNQTKRQEESFFLKKKKILFYPNWSSAGEIWVTVYLFFTTENTKSTEINFFNIVVTYCPEK